MNIYMNISSFNYASELNPNLSLVILCADERTAAKSSSELIIPPNMCGECNRTSSLLDPLYGRIDPDDDIWYCDTCWNNLLTLPDGKPYGHPQKWKTMVPEILMYKINQIQYVGQTPIFKYDLDAYVKGKGYDADIMLNEYCPVYGKESWSAKIRHSVFEAIDGRLKDYGYFISPSGNVEWDTLLTKQNLVITEITPKINLFGGKYVVYQKIPSSDKKGKKKKKSKKKNAKKSKGSKKK